LLIATNNYNYLWDWQNGRTVYPSAPGAERIDIDPNGKGCHKVWKKMAGTGGRYDSFYPALAIGPNKALYVGVYGGLMSIRDTP